MVTTTSRTRNARRHWWPRITATVLAAVTALGLATLTTPARADMPGSQCLCDGSAYQQGDALTAGGWEFVCHADGFGSARWSHTPAPDRRSTVYSSGARRSPNGAYSPGAFQPGTDYNDDCVGSQLVEGPDDLFEVIYQGGALQWRSVGSVSQWRFDHKSPRPPATWRSSSLCIDGSLT